MERIAELTDSAYDDLSEAQKKGDGIHAAESKYSAWAALLLRYHDAVERVVEGEGVTPMRPMA